MGFIGTSRDDLRQYVETFAIFGQFHQQRTIIMFAMGVVSAGRLPDLYCLSVPACFVQIQQNGGSWMHFYSYHRILGFKHCLYSEAQPEDLYECRVFLGFSILLPIYLHQTLCSMDSLHPGVGSGVGSFLVYCLAEG